MMAIKRRNDRQSGAVSLFVVIFAALLMMIVTVSFVQLMIKDQEQATSSDLSQSAYDSAQAGVEDAKRLLLLDQQCRNNIAPATVNCAAVATALAAAPGTSSTSCDALSKAGIVGQTNDETIIQQNEGDNNSASLNQAYTCVKIAVNTDDYKGTLSTNGSGMIPLRGVSEFDTVELSWFSQSDVSSTTDDQTVGFPTTGADVSLPRMGDKWQFNYPPLMRTQLMQMGGSFKLSDFDDSQAGNKSDANTLFLYPSATGVANEDFALDARRSPTNTPHQVKCNASFVDGEYACQATIKMPSPIDGNTVDRNAYLRLTALYNNAHYRVRLKKGATYVQFNQVQPSVDATGRADDVFRRIQARIELTGNFTYPEAAIDMQGNLCKNFSVTDKDADFSGTATCTP
jgi:Tfp pilus assembly protein PilX